MAKANLVLPDGTKVAIEGTAEEVSTLLARFSGSEPQSTQAQGRRRPRATSGAKSSRRKSARGPTGHILQLREENFFKARRSLPDIQRKLEEHGHIYAQSSLSPVLVRLVRAKELRRIKEKKNWVYVS